MAYSSVSGSRNNGLWSSFENGAPLGTFSNKINLAEAVHLVGPRTRGDLDRIRKVRNECAHSVNPVSFHDDRLKALIAAADTPGFADGIWKQSRIAGCLQTA